MRNWGRENFGVFHAVTVKFFLNRFPLPVSSLARIRSPIALVHCSEDIAYPIEDSEELLELLRRADLDAKLHSIAGAPHFGNVTHVEEYAAAHYFLLLLIWFSWQDERAAVRFRRSQSFGRGDPSRPSHRRVTVFSGVG